MYSNIELPPVLLLDVDGVLNVHHSPWPDKDVRHPVDVDGRRWPLRWSPLLIETLAELHMLSIIDIRWCTTWVPHAAVLERLWNLPPIPAAWDGDPADIDAAKIDAARRVLAEGRRLIWADDEVIPSAKKRRELGMTGDALYLTPSSPKGLTPKDITRMLTFAVAPLAGICV